MSAPYVKHADFLVIGGGSGGLGAARMASSKFGAKTIVVEGKRLGGTCVNVGCVPKKVTFHAATIAEVIRQATSYGFSVTETAPFGWATFKQKRDAYLRRLNEMYRINLVNEGVELVQGWAKLVNDKEAEVSTEDGSTVIIRAQRILIATGGFPANPPPDVVGAELGINSDGFFDIDTQPKKVALVGAGYIAVEFAGMFQALGTETHLFIRHDKFLRAFDPLIQETVTAEYERSGVALHKRSRVVKVERDVSQKLTVTFRNEDGTEKSESDFDHLIWAVGRTPAIVDIGLEKIGIATTKSGYIAVDEFQNTNVDGVYALGDVTGQFELTPVAIAAGRRLAERLFGPPQFFSRRLEYSNIPSVVFAHPEAGTIGLTEPQAIEQFGKDNIKVYKTIFTPMYYAIMEPERKAPAAYKLIVQGPNEKIVGFHIVGLDSAEILQGFGVAVKMGATKQDFDNCVAIHPTSAEELVTMK